MPIYSYEKSKISKKTKKPVISTWYMYSGRYVDENTGKSVNYKKRGFSTQKEAAGAERLFLAQVKDAKTSDITFNELTDLYFQDMVTRRKESTLHTTKGHLTCHITPFFEGKRVNKISSKDVMIFQSQKLKEGLSVSYVNTLTASLKKVLNHAAKHYGLSVSPANNIEKLRDDFGAVEDNIMVCWNENDFKKFSTIADDEQYKNYYTLLYYTGLRRGEALALTWKDIDLNNKTLKVTKTITNKVSKEERERGIAYKTTSPKTKNSIRTISLPNVLVNLLVTWKAYCERYDGFDDKCLVFGVFKPLPYVTIDRKIKAWAKEADIPILSPHGLRHSHISYLINNNVNILAVAKRAGDTVEIILQVYAHLFKENEDEIMNIMNADN